MTQHQFTTKQILHELIPTSIVEELQAFATFYRHSFFRIGDIAKELCARTDAAPDVGIGRMDVYETIAELLEHEVSPRTVRYYAAVAEFYPVEVRDEFHDLPFSHFDFAQRFPDRWRKILEYSLSYLTENGRAISVDRLSLWLAGNRMSLDGGTSVPRMPDELQAGDPGYRPFNPDQLFTSQQDNPYPANNLPEPQEFQQILLLVISILRNKSLLLNSALLQELSELRELIDKITS